MQTRRKRTRLTVVCLFAVAVLLLFEGIFAAHTHTADADEHCILCMISSRENLWLSICICTFVAALLTLSASVMSVGKKRFQTPVSTKVKLTN